MKVAVAGTGYVGLVAGVAFANIGHDVTCVDINQDKIDILKKGICPIYEKGLEELMHSNQERLKYTTDYKDAYGDSDIILIGVGTPEEADGSANLTYVYNVCDQIANSVKKDTIVIIKSTVPVGTNKKIDEFFQDKLKDKDIKIAVVSNPEFLAQGNAVKDTLHAARIIIGIEDEWAKPIIHKLYEPLLKEPYNQNLVEMGSRESSEMTKYASNAFLALKISYINEIANLCEKLGANIEEVANGMGYDPRIGNKFLKAGIGFGGSCFPKDTQALYWISKKVGSETLLIRDVIGINKEQKLKLFQKAYDDLEGDFKNKTFAILGVTFKPETDDLREATSIDNVKLLLRYGAKVKVYDPVGLDNFKKIFGDKVEYFNSIEGAITNCDVAFIMTEWAEIINFPLDKYAELMNSPLVYDGRNCYSLEEVKRVRKLNYTSIGRPNIKDY